VGMALLLNAWVVDCRSRIDLQFSYLQPTIFRTLATIEAKLRK
jgi:hypothetical protein